MRQFLMKILGALALSTMMFAAQALDTAGASCQGNACRAGDGNTAGGSCAGNYCSAGSAGTGGGYCLGVNCKAGNGGTAGGDCIGDYCQAGAGRTGGGNCIGKGCQAGHGGTVGGSCVGEGCKPANRGRVNQGEVVQNIGCCVAWANASLLTGRGSNVVAICNAMLKESNNPAKCAYRDRQYQWKEIEPASTVAPSPLPAPPTSLEEIIKQTRRPPDARCKFDCQAWNPASNSCVGAPMNGCSN